MVWIVVGAVVVLVLVGAWLYDRRWGLNEAGLPGADQRAAAEFEAWRTQQQMGPFDV